MLLKDLVVVIVKKVQSSSSAVFVVAGIDVELGLSVIHDWCALLLSAVLLVETNLTEEVRGVGAGAPRATRCGAVGIAAIQEDLAFTLLLQLQLFFALPTFQLLVQFEATTSLLKGKSYTTRTVCIRCNVSTLVSIIAV